MHYVDSCFCVFAQAVTPSLEFLPSLDKNFLLSDAFPVQS